MTNAYRYTLRANVSIQDVQDSLMLAILAMECLHGSAQTRLELSHQFDRASRTLVIGCATQVGRDLNRLFTGFLHKEFGPESFRVERITGE